MFANLLSFLGIEEEVALIVEVEIRPSLVLYLHIERLRQVHLIVFRFARSMRKRHTRA
jgi:hypothetical protein